MHVIAHIEQRSHGQHEGLLHLGAVGTGRELRLDQRHHGRDAKSREHDLVGQETGNAGLRGVQADFFTRLAQRGLGRIAVLRVDGATGERNLPRMLAQMVGPDREQDGRLAGMFLDADQHRRSA